MEGVRFLELFLSPFGIVDPGRVDEDVLSHTSNVEVHSKTLVRVPSAEVVVASFKLGQLENGFGARIE